MIKPDDHILIDKWGMTLAEQAQKKEGREAEELLIQAYVAVSECVCAFN